MVWLLLFDGSAGCEAMIFLLCGILLILMKLAHVEPVVSWDWFVIAIPFLIAVCWFEIVEPLLGWDAKRELNRQLALHRKIQDSNTKKPQHKGRGLSRR